MFRRKPKLKELLPGKELYNKLTHNLREVSGLTDRGTISTLLPSIPIQRLHTYTHAHCRRISFTWKAIFLTKNNEAGLVEIRNGYEHISNPSRYIYYAYFSSNELKTGKNYLQPYGGSIVKEIMQYTMHTDDVYVPKKKMEKIRTDVGKNPLKKVIKQLLKQKVKRR